MALRVAIVAFVAAVTLGAQAPADLPALVREADALARSDFGERRRRAEALYLRALLLVGEDKRLGARIALELGALVAGRGELAESQRWFSQAGAMYEAAGDAAGYAAALNQIGSIVLTLGRIPEARGLYAQSRAIWEGLNNARGQAQTHANDGLAWRASGEPQRALESNRRAVELFRAAGDQAGEATALHNNSEVLIDLGDYDEALRVATEALEKHQLAGPIGGEIHTRIHLAEAWSGKGDVSKAREQLTIAAARARQIGAPVQEAYILRETGRISMSLARPSDALARFQAALTLVPSEGFPRMEAEIRLQAGHAAYALKDLRDAGASWTRALALSIEIGNPLLQAEALAGLARIGRAQGRFTEALAQAARATDHIEASRAAIGNAAQRAHYLAVRSAAYGIHADLLVSLGQVDRAFEVSERAHARALLDALSHTPAGMGEGQQAMPLSAAVVRSSLDARTAVLEYLIGADTSLLFVLTRESTTAYRLPGRTALQTMTTALRDAVTQPGLRGLGRFVSASLDAHRTLIAPATRAIRGTTRLVIVPDGALHTVPFEILIDRPAASFASLPYLVRNRSVSYAPSMSVAGTLGESRRKGNASTGKALVAFARTTAAPGLPALTHAESEALAIAALFPADRADVLVGDAATEAAMHLPNVAQARHLHFATHALVRPPPGSSGLALGSITPGGDGYLEADEVARLRLTAELVVLSACDTALGRYVTGEGTLGLTRAFLLAGASGVVSSLWQVNDRSTAELMTSFYGGLGRGSAEALRAAKLRMIEQPARSHPYYWAGFVFSGH